MGFAPFGRGSLTLPRAILQALGTKACAGFAGLAFVLKKALREFGIPDGFFNTKARCLRQRAFSMLVIRLGFEPKTHSLEGCCSIQLSYRTNPPLYWQDCHKGVQR